MNHPIVVVVLVLLALPIAVAIGRRMISFGLGVIGTSRALSGNDAGAAAAYRLAVGINRKNRQAWTNLAVLSLRLGHLDEALAVAVRVTELAPGDPTAWSMYADILARAGHLNEAIACYETATQVGPWFPFPQERAEALRAALAAQEKPSAGGKEPVLLGREEGANPAYRAEPGLPSHLGLITDWDFRTLVARARALLETGHVQEAEWELAFMRDHRPPEAAVDAETRRVLSDAEHLHRRVREEPGETFVPWKKPRAATPEAENAQG